MSSTNSVQIWDNAAFDDTPGLNLGPAYLPLQPISLRPLKENRGPPQSNNKKPKHNIDAEIADVEAEIGRLSKKLEALKLKKKAQQQPSPAPPAVAPTPKRGRIVPAKFLTNLETPPPVPSSKKPQDSGGSRRRGLSLGPAEISKAQKPSFQKKLEGIKEEEKSLGRRRGMSLGPSEIYRQRPPVISSRAVSTVGSKKPAAKMDNLVVGIKPKALFEEKKKHLKARIVASRYNEDNGSKRRKWSLPEEAEKETGAKSKKRSFSLGGGGGGPSAIMKIGEGLPKIRTARIRVESPRDSGCAKRVAELAGRRPCFFAEDGDDDCCKSLVSFEDGDDDALSS